MSKDPTKDPLLSEAERWISDYDNQEGGALYDWNDETIKQFRDVPIETLLNDPYFLGLEGRLLPLLPIPQILFYNQILFLQFCLEF